jgi:hypothetical protein
MDYPDNVVKLPEPINTRDHLECPKCHATAELSCNCGVGMVHVKAIERAKQKIIVNPNRADRLIAKEAGVDGKTVAAARQQLGAEYSAPVKRIGSNGVSQSSTKRPKSTKREANAVMAKAVADAQAASPWPLTPGQRWAVKTKALGVAPPLTITAARPAKPIGRMPDDTREKFERHIEAITEHLTKVHKLMDYADQMSEPLRHRLADRLKGIRGHAEELARTMLGNNDLRKITTTLCHVDIPLRKYDDTNSQLPGEGILAATVDEQSG